MTESLDDVLDVKRDHLLAMLARFDNMSVSDEDDEDEEEDDDEEMVNTYDFDDYDFDSGYIKLVYMLKKEASTDKRCERERERNFSELHYDNDIADITEDLKLLSDGEDVDAWAKWTCDEEGNLEDIEEGKEDDEEYNDELTYFLDREDDDDKLTESQKAKTREIAIMKGRLRFKIMLARVRKDIEADKCDPDYKPDPFDVDTDYETDSDCDDDAAELH